MQPTQKKQGREGTGGCAGGPGCKCPAGWPAARGCQEPWALLTFQSRLRRRESMQAPQPHPLPPSARVPPRLPAPLRRCGLRAQPGAPPPQCPAGQPSAGPRQARSASCRRGGVGAARPEGLWIVRHARAAAGARGRPAPVLRSNQASWTILALIARVCSWQQRRVHGMAAGVAGQSSIGCSAAHRASGRVASTAASTSC